MKIIAYTVQFPVNMDKNQVKPYSTLDFFLLVRTGQVTKGQVWFSKSKPKILARTRGVHQSFYFQKIQGGPNINNFLWIGTKLPFALLNKRRETNSEFEF